MSTQTQGMSATIRAAKEAAMTTPATNLPADDGVAAPGAANRDSSRRETWPAIRRGMRQVCPACGEAYPVRHGDRCKGCQGESPYLEIRAIDRS